MSRDEPAAGRRVRVLLLVPALVAALLGGIATSSAVAAPAAPSAPAAPAVAVEPQQKIGASLTINGVSFDPGYIISDALFYDDDGLSVAQIQEFLDRKIGSCSNGLCLNVYRMNTTTRAADRNICTQYSGASNESVATIIFKVQQACGVSAQVLLATLQKEQGLITNSAPSAGRLQIAMGYACPDTAACDSKYYGFFNQMYSAAWQFKRYSTPTPWGNVQPGWESIAYNPNAECGRVDVHVRNNATAALYNYTPYTPNSAALATTSGTAPPCGSYGNRNFWVYYNSWFGSSVGGSPLVAIDSLYLTLGGADGELGAAGPAPTCASNATSCSRTYAHGLIYWTSVRGPLAADGAIGDYLLAHLTSVGAPLGAEISIVSPNGNGWAQNFDKGTIHSSAQGTFMVPRAMIAPYTANGWVRGDLGWPAGDGACSSAGNCVQQLARGWLVLLPNQSSGVMASGFATQFTAAGGPTGTLGYPTTLSVRITDPNGNGYAQGFQNGMLHAGPAGTFLVSGAIMTKYNAEGWLRGYLGWPIGAAVCSVDSCSQSFAGGVITVPTGGPPKVIFPGSAAEISALHSSLGGDAGALGTPTAGVTAISDPHGNGYVRPFSKGWAYSSATGTFAVLGTIQTAYASNGWLRGKLGWPTAAEVCDAAGCTQTFAGGTITAPTGQPARVLLPVSDPDIRALYDSLGGSTGWLGYPIGDSTYVTDPNGNGDVQKFDNGWIHSSTLGTFAIPAEVMTAYVGAGWLRGIFGWPKTDSVCDAKGCTQRFAGGMIRDPLTGLAFVVGSVSDTRILGAYLAAGGVDGWLGYATSQVVTIYDPNGNGKVQLYENGAIHYSSAGTFTTPAALMTAYSAQGWLRGPLGWPTSDAVCDAGGCTQTYQHGTIDTH